MYKIITDVLVWDAAVIHKLLTDMLTSCCNPHLDLFYYNTMFVFIE